MAAASPSTDRRPFRPGRWERFGALGIALCLISLPLPWYRVRFDDRLSQAGASNMGFAHLALLITLGAAAVLIYRGATGQRPPLPLHAGTLLAIAGGWALVIIAVLATDPPETTVRGIQVDYRTAYGVFVALGGAAIMVLAGVRLRKFELSSEEPSAPSAPSQPRSGG